MKTLLLLSLLSVPVLAQVAPDRTPAPPPSEKVVTKAPVLKKKPPIDIKDIKFRDF